MTIIGFRHIEHSKLFKAGVYVVVLVFFWNRAVDHDIIKYQT